MSATPEAVAAWRADREEVWQAAAVKAQRAERVAEKSAVSLADWPAPEVPCRPAGVSEAPSGARTAQRLAEAAGWAVRVTYARGTKVAGRLGAPKPGPVVDSVAVRCRRGGEAVVAIWIDGRFETAIMMTREGPSVANLTRFKNVIQLPTTETPPLLPTGKDSTHASGCGSV